MKWENRDWFWLLGLTIFVSGTSYMYKNEVMSLISYTSTFVSIALAFIAIYISVREATKTDRIKDETLSTLVEIRERISQVDSKVSSIDFTSINQINERVDQVFSKLTEKVQEYKENEEHADTPEGQLINEKVKLTWEVLSEELKEELKEELTQIIAIDIQTINKDDNWELLNNILTKVYENLSKESKDGKFSFLMIYQQFALHFKGNFSFKNKLAKLINDAVDYHVRMKILSVDSDGRYTYNIGRK
ncbi:hypothetical protein RB298_27230 [Priestia sp. BR_2]